mmetsp:Transcript_50135/g.121476  ORF Transcript_50135/g.121476 Transcript_50135/m.121476 type:complete len:260 (-) Transcript_50135:1962-2741(-)
MKLFEERCKVLERYPSFTNLSFCPHVVQEIDGVCYDNNIIPEQAEDAEAICKGEDGGYLPDFSSLPSDTEAFADLLLSGNEEVWISPFGFKTSLSLETYPFCTRLDSFGNEINLEGEEECSSFRGILCAAAVKEGIIGRNYTSYFRCVSLLSWGFLSARICHAVTSLFTCFFFLRIVNCITVTRCGRIGIRHRIDSLIQLVCQFRLEEQLRSNNLISVTIMRWIYSPSLMLYLRPSRFGSNYQIATTPLEMDCTCPLIH